MKGLDWSNERYVRLHVRDSPGWAMLSYDAQCLRMQLLRKMDRSGCIVLDSGYQPHESIAAMLRGCDVGIVESALAELLAGGWLVLRNQVLTDPEFIEREEASMTTKHRSREYRRRRRDQAMTQDDTPENEPRHEAPQGVTRRHAESSLCATCDDTVTKRDAPATERDETVTGRHRPSLRTVPCRRREDPPVVPPVGGTTKKAKRATRPEIPAALAEAIPGFGELWQERMATPAKKPTPSAEAKQLAKLVTWLAEYGVQGVRDSVESATTGGYQGIFPPADKGSGNRSRPRSRSRGETPVTNHGVTI